MNCNQLMIVRLEQRRGSAPELQRILTEFGCAIKLRLGLHETDENFCAEDGLILLQLCADAETAKKLEAAIRALPGARAKCIDLDQL